MTAKRPLKATPALKSHKASMPSGRLDFPTRKAQKMNSKSEKRSDDLCESEAEGFSGTLQFQPEKYRKYLDESGWSESKKDEWLNTLWKLMCTFVDVAWGIDPDQTAMPSLAKLYAESCSEMAQAKSKPSSVQENLSQARTTKTSSVPPKNDA
jgi:hypothetical protein